jgi:hypothetical protein
MQKQLKELMTKREELRVKMDEMRSEYMKLGEDMALCIEADALPLSNAAPRKRTPAKPKAPNYEATAKRYEDFEPAESGCLCGCGEHVDEGTLFVRGHQHRLRSIALAFEAGKIARDKMSDDGYAHSVSQGWIVEAPQ